MKQFVWITTLFLTLAAPTLALADRVGSADMIVEVRDLTWHRREGVSCLQ